MSFDVETRNLAGQVTAVGAAGPFTLVIDRPAQAGGGGLGFNGGQLLYLAVAGCVSNDLFREAAAIGVALDRVVVRVVGDFVGSPAVSTAVGYEVEISGDAPPEKLRELVEHVDRIAEIPNSLRAGTPVELRATHVGGQQGFRGEALDGGDGVASGDAMDEARVSAPRQGRRRPPPPA